jgi:hypothetical protein
MSPEKLLGRMEQVEWSPPVLTFVIERHGRTCVGSTRADLYRWTINFITKTANCEKVGHRQLCPMARRLAIQPFAEEIAAKIIQGQGMNVLSGKEVGSPGGPFGHFSHRLWIQADR